MTNNLKQPPWFKMWLRDKPLIDVMADAVVGRAVKAAMIYFATGEVVDLEPQELALFAMVQSHIDEAYSDYLRDVENGKKGGRPKGKDDADLKPPVKEDSYGYPTLTEVEVEGDVEEKEIDKEINQEIYLDGIGDGKGKVIEKNKDVHKEIIGDREGVGGKEPSSAEEFETLRQIQISSYKKSEAYNSGKNHQG